MTAAIRRRDLWRLLIEPPPVPEAAGAPSDPILTYFADPVSCSALLAEVRPLLAEDLARHGIGAACGSTFDQVRALFARAYPVLAADAHHGSSGVEPTATRRGGLT